MKIIMSILQFYELFISKGLFQFFNYLVKRVHCLTCHPQL